MHIINAHYSLEKSVRRGEEIPQGEGRKGTLVGHIFCRRRRAWIPRKLQV
jgi:hypothetical protein